jgi:hypothetical protein
MQHLSNDQELATWQFDSTGNKGSLTIVVYRPKSEALEISPYSYSSESFGGTTDSTCG